MAKVRVDIIGDSSSLKRALGEAGVATEKVHGQFGALAKSVAGLGAAFIGVSGVVEAFSKSVKAAEDLNVATKQLGAQLRASGESFKQVAPYVADLNAKFEKLGFTNAETEASFTRLLRASGSAAIAYKEMGLAADLAAAKHIAFSQAALLIGKVIDGNTAALNRYGIAIPKGTSAINALAIAHSKLAGQAAAAATPMRVFSATVTDLEAKIGNQLLPVIDKYLEKIDRWMSKSQNQEKVTNAVAKAISFFEQTVSTLASVIQAVLPTIESVVQSLGGLKRVIEDLVALKVAMALTQWGQSFAAVGTKASGAKGQISGLSGVLKALPTAIAITVGLNIIENAHTTKSGLHRYSGAAGWGNLGNDIAGVVGLDWQGKSNTMTGVPGQLNTLTSGSAMKSFIAQQAKRLGLDPKAVLGVATAEGGFNGAIGDGGHAFGPFQMNDAGGVLTGFKGDKQGFANSTAGIMYALKGIAAVAKGLKGMAAISAIIGQFERPKDPTHDLNVAGGYYFGGGSGQSMAGIQNGLPGSLSLPNMSAAKKAAAAPKAPAYKIPQALQASVKKAEDSFKNGVTKQHLDILTSLLQQEETLLKQHGDLAKAASIANEIKDAQKKLADSFAKLGAADLKAATADATKAVSAFGKKQFGVAASYIDAEVKSLKAAQVALKKAIANAPKGDAKGYENQLAAVTSQLNDTKGVSDWIEGIAKIFAGLNKKLSALAKQNLALTNQRTAAAELQAVGYFNDTADTITGIDEALVTNLQQTKQADEDALAKLKAKLADAPKKFRAGLQAQIAGMGSTITGLTGAISQAMGTVEQDLAAAVTQAQGVFSAAIGNLQSTLDAQIQTNAENATGYTADSQALAQMQAADQLGGLTDALTAAQNQLAADTAAGATATADQIAQDQKALTAAQRALTEYNLGIKAAGEQAQATAQATEKTNQFNSALGDLEGQLLSGKITAAQFETALTALSQQFGVNIDTTGAQFLAVSAAAAGVVGAFDSLIGWINSQTGSNIPDVGGSTSGGGGSSGDGGVAGRAGEGTGGATNTVNPPATATYTGGDTSGATTGGRRPGLQFARGGVVPMLHALSGMVVPGMPHGIDYVPAMVNGGEMILNSGQQMNLWKMANGASNLRLAGSRSGGGEIHNHFNFPNYAGDKRELVTMLRQELNRIDRRNR